MWAVVVIVCGVVATLGYFFGATFTGVTGARAAAFAAGGLLAMLANSLMPFAFARGGILAGVFTVIGFAIAVATS
jgi:ZIP family zinc transporter